MKFKLWDKVRINPWSYGEPIGTVVDFDGIYVIVQWDDILCKYHENMLYKLTKLEQILREA